MPPGDSTEQARCLPAEAYTTERLSPPTPVPERRTLFRNRWICIGLVDDVPGARRCTGTPLEVAGQRHERHHDREPRPVVAPSMSFTTTAGIGA